MTKFESFIKYLPDDCVIDVRISDDVLDEEDWRIDQLTLTRCIVRYQNPIATGVYPMPDMVGGTVGEVLYWSRYQDFGGHPTNYHEVKQYPI